MPYTARLTLLLLLALIARPAAAQENVPLIRVGLMDREAPARVVVSGHEGGLAVHLGDDDAPLALLGAGEAVGLERQGDEVRLDLPDGTLFALDVRLVPERAFAVAADGAGEPKPYEGALHVTAHDVRPGLLLVNHVALEDYVASVIGGEYGLPDVEGTKAMAVAIRTYALRSGGKFGDAVDHVDHILSQHYLGLRAVTDTTRAAARATRGEVLTYGGEPIEAVYFSSSGGHTADNEAVWDGRRLPYLRGKPDPYDAISPHSSWRSTVARGRLLAVLGRETGRTARGFVLGERGADGRLRTVEVLHGGGRRTEMQANRFRLAVNDAFGIHTLKSTRFDARRAGDRYVFEGSGYGHGVGLSQWGAHGMARRGHDYRDILAFYYTGVALGRHDSGATEALAAPALADAAPAPAEPPTRTGSDPDPTAPPPPRPAPPRLGMPSPTGTTDADTTTTSPADPVRPRRIGW